MAKELPNHHILSVELLRTHNDETVAVITAVKDRMPVRFVVRGDASGRVKLGPVEHREPNDRHGPGEVGYADQGHLDPSPRLAATAMAAPVAASMAAPMAAPMASLIGGDGGVTPEGMALGEPPPQQPPRPGMIGIGGALLAVAFGAGEQVPV
jgi:hypothetical protein